MRVLVAGHENWADANAIWREIDACYPPDHPESMLVAHAGRARGLDMLVACLCEEAGIQQVVFPATPSQPDPVFHYKTAIKILQPHMLLAFHKFMPNSKTTKQIYEYAQDRGIMAKQVSM